MLKTARSLQRYALLQAALLVETLCWRRRKGEKVFKKCKACHAVEEGKNKTAQACTVLLIVQQEA